MENDTDALSILIIRLSALGDVANVLPAVAALRKISPEVRMTWLTQSASRDLVAASGLADDIILFPRKELAALWRSPTTWTKAIGRSRAVRRELRERRFDMVLDFQGNLKSGLLSAATGARTRVGFASGHCREFNWLFNTVLATPASTRMLRAEKNAALVQVLEPDLQLEPVSLNGTDADNGQVEAYLAEIGNPARLFLFHPGTSGFGSFKRWPAERFGELAMTLAQRHGATCVITRGPDEAELAESVRTASEGAAHVAPVMPIGALVELIKRADLFVAGDTGPLHIAALLKRPMVAIFGPKDPAIYRPWSDTAVVVRKDLPCSPCTRRKCDHASCVLEISVEDVLQGAERVLAGLPETGHAERGS